VVCTTPARRQRCLPPPAGSRRASGRSRR
jgi:hypothetical protein